MHTSRRPSPLPLVALVLAAAGLLSAGASLAVPSKPMVGTVILKPDKIFRGVALIGARDGIIRLVEPTGVVLHEWVAEEGAEYGYAKATDDGHILTFKTYDDGGRSVVELTWDNQTVFEYFETEELRLHHDFNRLDSGNYLLMCSREIDRPEISDQTLTDDCLIEVDPSGATVWEWQTADHFDEFGFDQEELDGIFAAGGDWAHANAAWPIPSDTSHTDPRFLPGDVVISYRFISRVVVVDRETGIYNWISAPAIGQHDTKMLPDSVPGGGNILIFDNGFGEKYSSSRPAREYSKVLEVDPVTDEVVWEYDATDSNLPRWYFDSWFVSGADRLPNGNTLIVEGAFGRVFEVTTDGEIVWEFVSPWRGPDGRSDDPPLSNRLYRAQKVAPTWVP